MQINLLYEDFNLSDMDDVDWTDTMSDADDAATEQMMIMWCKEQGIDEKLVSIDKDGISLLYSDDVDDVLTRPAIRIILRPGQTELPFPLNVVDVNVDVSWNGLTSMKNFPKVIRGGLFNANYNLITSLDNLPVIDMPVMKPVCGWPAISLSFNNFSGPDKITAATDMTWKFLKSDNADNYMSDAQRYMPSVDFSKVNDFTVSSNSYGYVSKQQYPAQRINLAGNRALNKYDLGRNMSERPENGIGGKLFLSKSLRKKYISDQAKKLRKSI